MWIAPEKPGNRGLGETHLGKHCGNALEPFHFCELGHVLLEALADNLLDGTARTKRRKRVLKHHLYALSGGRQHLASSIIDAHSVNLHLACGEGLQCEQCR